MPLFDLTEFFKLSSVLNYNLSAASLNRYNVLMYITDNKRLDGDDKIDREKKAILMEVLGYLFSAYRQKRRRLGPMAVLHPLRAAALFTRTRPRLDLVELLSLLFHDILEDVKPGQFGVQDFKDRLHVIAFSIQVIAVGLSQFQAGGHPLFEFAAEAVINPLSDFHILLLRIKVIQ